MGHFDYIILNILLKSIQTFYIVSNNIKNDHCFTLHFQQKIIHPMFICKMTHLKN